MTARMGRTTVSELRERIEALGGKPRGDTIAVLLDELTTLDNGGGGGGGAAPYEVGHLSAEDFDDIFGEG